MSESLAAFVAEVRAIVGDGHVLTDPDVIAGYVVDWTGRWTGSGPAVVRPGSVEEVAGVVAAARAHRVALVPQGGNTGLVGGSVPLAGEVVLVVTRLDRLDPVDTLAGQVTVGAGVTLSRLQAHARSAGLAFGVDLGARDTATIGGMIATNAGGLHVIRHGTMRAQVVGIEAVLGDGSTVRRLSGLTKDNTGYDLAGLLCGSEGTLGVITAARLWLVPWLEHALVAMVGLPNVGAAVELLPRLRQLPSLHAVELMLADGMQLAGQYLGSTPPVDGEAALIIECASNAEMTDELAAVVGELDAVVAIEEQDRARLWRFREAHPEAAATLGVVHKLDVTMPAGAIAEFVDDVRAVVERVAPGATCLIYGHLGDGNLHVNVVGPAADDEAVDDAVLGLVVERGGSISAEHGIGTAKRGWLLRARSEAEVAAYRAIKAALDPDDILNPNALLP